MLSVAIVGGTGYTGAELIRLLLSHPKVSIRMLTSRTEAGKSVCDIFPNLRGHTNLSYSDFDLDQLKQCDIIFFATPHGVAMQHAQALVDAGCKIIDLGADFRLQDLEQFSKWYGLTHQCPELLKQSIYGLSELNRQQIRAAKVIGCPGCYPTTVQIGLAPLLSQPNALIDEQHIIVDAKSGVTGAGKKAEMGLLYSENSDNFKAYATKGHRHHPEIVERLQAISGRNNFQNLIFTPHLVPMVRGMLSTIYVQLTDAATAVDLQQLYLDFYQDESFVDVMPIYHSPETRSTRGSNNIRISLNPIQNSNQLVILVAQDNLMKGAAGQAVQNMNIICDFDEKLGLNQIACLP